MEYENMALVTDPKLENTKYLEVGKSLQVRSGQCREDRKARVEVAAIQRLPTCSSRRRIHLAA